MNYLVVIFVTLKPQVVLMIRWGWIKLCEIDQWYKKRPMGIIRNKTPLVLMKFHGGKFCHFKTTVCFIHNTGLDLNSVKSTHGNQ